MDYPVFDLLEGFDIPLPVTLACACVCSYLIGQLPFARTSSLMKSKKAQANDRAKRLIDRLAGELEVFRNDLAVHEACLQDFKHELRQATDSESPAEQFDESARQAMRAMERLADELPQSFDSIRQKTASTVEALLSDLQRHRAGDANDDGQEAARQPAASIAN